LLSIVIAASYALLFAIATDELFNGLNSNGEIAIGLCVEGPILLNISEFPHRSRESSYSTQFILTDRYNHVVHPRTHPLCLQLLLMDSKQEAKGACLDSSNSQCNTQEECSFAATAIVADGRSRWDCFLG
jgi:hypothetical protein